MGETSPAGRELTAAILVVDDEPAIVKALAYLLRRRGHAVDTAAQGHLALKKLQTRAYDLILRDLRMPECDGPAIVSRKWDPGNWPGDLPRKDGVNALTTLLQHLARAKNLRIESFP
jgi:DNA-binding NarL/FixJ family response regulator